MSEKKNAPDPRKAAGAAPAKLPAKGDKISGDTGGGKSSGRQIQGGQPDTEGSRGSSMQGPKQDAKGGPAGASQGGAPRGANRLEPSHLKERQKEDRAKTPKGGKPKGE